MSRFREWLIKKLGGVPKEWMDVPIPKYTEECRPVCKLRAMGMYPQSLLLENDAAEEYIKRSLSSKIADGILDNFSELVEYRSENMPPGDDNPFGDHVKITATIDVAYRMPKKVHRVVWDEDKVGGE